MLIGQNPGKEEAKQRRPFVGRAGKYLDRVLKEKGIDRSTLFITSVVRETTPGNRKPTTAEIKRWMPRLPNEISEVEPEVIVLMGRVAWDTPRLRGPHFFETYHPAAAMRFPRIRQKFERDIDKLKEHINSRHGQ
jgi:DNA polymerase